MLKSVLFGDFSAYYIGHAELLGADESVTA